MTDSAVYLSHPKENEMEDVIRLTCRHLSEQEYQTRVDAVLDQYKKGAISLNSIWQGHIGNKRVAALFAQERPDKTLLLWHPTTLPPVSSDIFVKAIEEFCVLSKLHTAIILVDRNQQIEESGFLHSGCFQFQSTMLHLVCETKINNMSNNIEPSYSSETIKTDSETLSSTSGCLDFVPMQGDSSQIRCELTDLVEATYQNTADFPNLMQKASAKHVLANYQSAEEFRPELWFCIKAGTKKIGVLLMTDQAETQIELTYMGMIPEYRGRGFSQLIVRFAIDVAIRQNRQWLLTSVDEQNSAALRAYLTAGFQTWDRKKVFARFFTT
ncbi:MAG: GNAT family N-acetyltransferase [Thermoguttaceae bacterium]